MEWLDTRNGAVFCVSQGIGAGPESEWQVFRRKPNGTLTRKGMPRALYDIEARTADEAMDALGRYGTANGLSQGDGSGMRRWSLRTRTRTNGRPTR
jgi:hypothetical protein